MSKRSPDAACSHRLVHWQALITPVYSRSHIGFGKVMASGSNQHNPAATALPQCKSPDLKQKQQKPASLPVTKVLTDF
jgi:hypothetical protein